MSKKRRKLLDRSLAWIRGNMNATNHDVPDEFIGAWIYEEADEEEERPTGFFFSVFAFGYMQHEILTGPMPTSTPRSVPIARMFAYFDRWQMKLALAEIHRHTEIQVEPMPLFCFPEGELIRYRPRAGAQSTTDSMPAPNS